MKKRIRTLFGCLGAIVLFAACGPKEAPKAEVSVVQEAKPELVFPAAIAEYPAVLSSAGQSMDVRVVQTLLKKGEISCDMDEMLTAESLTGYNTLILAAGGSAKGLAAAGVDADEELERVRTLIAEAKKQEMTLLVLHIGGSSRRGPVSDRFLSDTLKAADAAIILSEGDSDGMIRGILTENEVPALYVDRQIDAVEPLAALFE